MLGLNVGIRAGCGGHEGKSESVRGRLRRASGTLSATTSMSTMW